MRNIMLMILALLILLPSTAMAETKFAVIDMETVIRTCEPGQKALDTLKQRFQTMKADLDKEQGEIQAMREELNKQSLVLSAEAKQDKEIEFKRRVRDYQDMLQNYQRKIKTEESRLSKPIVEMVVKAIKEYGKANGYTAIVDAHNSGIVYFSEAADITKLIIVEINRNTRAGKK
ncbi:MAG: OmpH family outer membrane protein [Desulfovibrionaceae bacterium]|jgi:outer membrane protein|nr:OmpH family outer membrane protein [Desulfovibrionaceae bacterium]